jgi:predicted dehydrogenase
MAKTRIGLIGCGWIGKQHLKALRDNADAQIAAVGDVREEAAKAYAEEFSADEYFGSGLDLIEKGNVEGVVLALPAGYRYELVLAALRRGLHVLIEKPIGRSADEVKEMIAVRGSSVAGCCSSRFRFFPPFEIVRSSLADSRIGDVRQIYVRDVGPVGAKPETLPPTWRLSREINGGGFFVNKHSYVVDYILALFDWKLEPTAVMGRTWPVPQELGDWVHEGQDAEIKVSGQVRFAGGATFDVDAAEMSYSPRVSFVEIHGSAGALRFSAVPSDPFRVILYTVDAQSGIREDILWEGDVHWPLQHTGVINNFVAAIRGTEEIATNLEHSLVVQTISDAMYASSESGHCIEI